jgi:hypothetical protein
LPGDLKQKCEHALPCSIMTTRPPTHPWKPQSLWLAGLSPWWFHVVSQIENETEGTTFWNSVWHPKGIRNCTEQH